jgi:hypothetical protein
MIGDCFRILLESFSSDYAHVIFRCIAATPLSDAKDVSCVFASFMAALAPITFPNSHAVSKFVSCEAFSVLLKFRRLDLDVSTLLQDRSVPRALHFASSHHSRRC